MTDTKYVCRFERIGRNRNVPDLTVTVPSGIPPIGRIELAVAALARKHLSSRFFDVDVELGEDGRGAGFLSWGRSGKFSVEVVD